MDTISNENIKHESQLGYDFFFFGGQKFIRFLNKKHHKYSQEIHRKLLYCVNSVSTDYGHPIKTYLNQGYLKNWADVADKICFGRT